MPRSIARAAAGCGTRPTCVKALDRRVPCLPGTDVRIHAARFRKLLREGLEARVAELSAPFAAS